MFSPLLLAAALLALLATPVRAQSTPSAPSVTPEQMRRHIEVLASDDYGGRQPGTESENKTLLYIATQFARLGLQPAAGGGSWYQPVPLVQRRPFAQRARFAWGERRVDFGHRDLILVGRGPVEQLRDAPVLFVGAGTSPVDRDLRGAVVLMLHAAPKAAPAFDERAAAAVAAGAAAVIALVGDAYSWPAIEAAYRGGSDRLQSETVARIAGAMPLRVASSLFSGERLDLGQLAASAARPDFRPVPLGMRATLEVTTEVREYLSHNVVGRLPGSRRTGESLLFLGHWDHLGICRREGEPDRICNGAVDNASGIAMLIEIARNLAAGKRPSRDLLFMATTAEEIGLLGAEHFAANPVVPLSSVVAAINLDTVAIHRAGEPVAVIGKGTASLDRLIAETAGELGRSMDSDTEADAFVTRQDGWALMRAGVPAVMVGGSFADMRQLGAFLSGPYHKPEDDLEQELVLDGAAEDAELLVALGRKLADPKIYQPPRR